MKTIAVLNQKGGTGKSTTVLAMAGGLSLRGHKVLAVDLDSQCNLSLASGADMNGTTTMELLTRRAAAADAVQHLVDYDIIPGSQNLSAADITVTEVGKEYRLKEALSGLMASYDYIIIDCPPALGVLTINALTAADSVVVPAQADLFSIQGLVALGETIDTVRQYCNHSLQVCGVLLTRYNGRAVLSRDMTDMVTQVATNALKTKVFDVRIRENISIKEAQASQQNLFTYAPKSNGAADYGMFLDELLKR